MRAMACTSHPLSSQTAIDILKDGGNALDAAVAACAVQCVVEPQATGIGGDCFCLYWPAGAERPIAYNGSGRAPAAATAELYASQGIGAIARTSPHAVTIPGAVEAWDRLVADHGRKSLNELLLPAIAYARDGYPLAPRVRFDFEKQIEMLRGSPAASRIFLRDGAVPPTGAVQRQPELAATLAAIGERGREAFYLGEIAAGMTATLAALGGFHTEEDFAAHRGEYVEPVSSEFRGYRIWECPPNGQGVIALLLLNMLSEAPLWSGPLDPERVHLEIEAARLAYRARDLHLADPAFASVPVSELLSLAYARQLLASIDPAKARPPAPEPALPRSSTVTITIVDEERNACSFINSLFTPFGSGIMTEKSGIMMNNRAQGFSLDAASPNCIAPGKRPLHTIIPGLASKDARPVMPFGVMGAAYQAFGHAQFLTRLLDYGLDIQDAMDCPRFFPDPETGKVEAESGIPAGTLAALRARGHDTIAASRPIGGAQAIWIDWVEGVLTGGSDPRKDGCAIGY
jgi:gamma-glutamyltranspeptidase/glutathione hydrolase